MVGVGTRRTCDDTLEQLSVSHSSMSLRTSLAAALLIAWCGAACFDFSVPGNTVVFDFDGGGPNGPLCLEDGDCGVRQVCVRGTCAVGCRTSVDCPSGEVCGGDPAQCLNALECQRDTDCGGDAPVCHPTLSICVRCIRADDCSGGDVCLVDPSCLSGRRVCARTDYTCGLCTNDNQCASSVCDTETGRCTECTGQFQCGVGEVCDRELGICTECVSDGDCREPLPACLRTEVGGQCVLCAEDADCGEGTCNRDTQTCQGCLSDEDCRGDGLSCNPGSGLCFDESCAFREMPALLEIAVEAEIAAPYLAGPLAAASLRDNDGDGLPSPKDRAEIAAPMSPPQSTGPALALWTADGARRLWTASSNLGAVRGVALGDIDGDNRVDTVALRDGRLVAFDTSGSPMWTSGSRTSHLPGLFDVDSDGYAEIVAGGSLFSEVGQRIWVGQAHQGGHAGLGLPGLGLAAQLDGRGPLEIVAGGTVYSAEGEVICTEGLDGYTAIANITGDDAPELIVVSSDTSVRALSLNCELLWGPVVPGEGGQGGGPAAIVDLDGDTAPEIVYVARSDKLAAVDGDGSLMWEAELVGAHLAAAVSAVDLDADGLVEVLVSDSEGLKVFRGADGFMLTEKPEGASILALSAPMVLDVDADDATEIVVAATSEDGANDRIVVFGDIRDRWVDTRNTWNQVSYFVHNIQDNMRAPAFLPQWWLSSNTFRSQPTRVSSQPAPNLQVRRLPGAVDLGDCPDRYVIGVSVYNRGLLPVAPGAELSATIAGEDQRLLSTFTTKTLQAGDEEVIVLTFSNLWGPVDLALRVARPEQDEALVPECNIEDNLLILDGVGCRDAF